MAGLEFYASDLGDRLIDERNYPPEIQEFLRLEAGLLHDLTEGAQTVVEVGCMEGRSASPVIRRGKRYLGIDVVPRYIDRARELNRHWSPGLCTFALGAAEHLPTLLASHGIPPGTLGAMLYFPFNSIGNMTDLGPVATALANAGVPFFVSSYVTNGEATAVRERYYASCQYHDLEMHEDDRGVIFRSSDGLRSVAYHPEHVIQVFSQLGVRLEFIPFGFMGAAYVWRGNQ